MSSVKWKFIAKKLITEEAWKNLVFNGIRTRDLREYRCDALPAELYEATHWERGQFIWVIDQVWGQDGWILAKFFYCMFMDRDEVEVHKHAIKERG